VGRVSDEELYQLYAKAKGFIALAKEEDFGMTVVEAMAAGTPVIAFNGGGFRETVIEGITGTFVNEVNISTLKQAINRIDKIHWNKADLLIQARKFSKEIFVRKMKEYIKNA
jgi:glycosyltransferase involved in cell wall biosynthesis